jgi:prevent-host-death family protein
MKTIGIRELRQHASKYLRMAEAGETIEVTDRGRPVARIVPVPERPRGGLARLIAEGRISEAEGDLLDVVPMPPIPGKPLPSEVLAQLREHER